MDNCAFTEITHVALWTLQTLTECLKNTLLASVFLYLVLNVAGRKKKNVKA